MKPFSKSPRRPASHIIFVADREAEPGARPAEALVELEDAAMHFQGLAGARSGSVPHAAAKQAHIEKTVPWRSSHNYIGKARRGSAFLRRVTCLHAGSCEYFR